MSLLVVVVPPQAVSLDQREHDREGEHRHFRVVHEMAGARLHRFGLPLVRIVIKTAQQIHRSRTLPQRHSAREQLMTFVISPEPGGGTHMITRLLVGARPMGQPVCHE